MLNQSLNSGKDRGQANLKEPGLKAWGSPDIMTWLTPALSPIVKGRVTSACAGYTLTLEIFPSETASSSMQWAGLTESVFMSMLFIAVVYL
jgi:hypothetical protein